MLFIQLLCSKALYMVSAPLYTLKRVLNINLLPIKALFYPELYTFITGMDRTIMSAVSLYRLVIRELYKPHVRQLIEGGYITLGRFLRLDMFEQSLRTLCDPAVRQLIAAEHITIEQVLNLNTWAATSLLNAGVRQLIATGIVTVEQLAIINNQQLLDAITAQDNIERILLGRLTVARLLIDGADPINRVQINTAQSTHTTSVNKSVFASALRLMQRYGVTINQSLEDTIQKLKYLINELSDGAIMDNIYDCVRPAKDAISRITADNYVFVGPGSNISTRQLLALVYVAIHDDTLRIGSKDDAIFAFVKGLRELQREYNLNATGTIDDGQLASPACSAGTFNKIINCLQGIHPDCNIIFITKETMSARLKPLTNEYLKKYYDDYSKMLKNFEYLNIDRDNKSWDDSWKIIKPVVKKAMLTEFESYYATDKSSKKHIDDIVDAGKYLSFTQRDLDKLRSNQHVLKRRMSCTW